MRVLGLLACVLGLAAAEVAVGYHERVGIPLATKIRLQESMRIAGGYASYLGEHPYLAGLVIMLTNYRTSMCGGTLLSHYRVVTTAQCWYDGYMQATSITVVLGSVRLFTGGTRVKATTITKHPDFDPYTVSNDIAMLQIPYVSYTANIKPILLPRGMNSTFVGQTAEVIGFGGNSNIVMVSTGQSLRDVFVPVISNAACAQSYGSIVTSSVLCTSGTGGKGPCRGDSGGPLILRYFNGTSDLLIGLISFGSAESCQLGNPSGHTRVTSYMNWIDSFLS